MMGKKAKYYVMRESMFDIKIPLPLRTTKAGNYGKFETEIKHKLEKKDVKIF